MANRSSTFSHADFRCGKRRSSPVFTRLALAAASALIAGQALAQQESQTVTVSGRNAANAASVAGFGDVPLSRSPFSATVISTRQLQDAGIASFADITRLDAGITDAYNAPGYWNQVAVRGFTLDARSNFRRDGLPINAETVIATGNKAAVEVLKGTSGLQAGTSAPGGLLNYVVARPTGHVRSAELHWTQPGTVGAAMDLGERSGADGAFGWRVHADADHLDPSTRNSRGERWLSSAAIDARLSPTSLLEAELEFSRQSQPSAPGFSLLGNRLPSASSIDPRINLNNQAWSLPVVFTGSTGSLRYTQAVNPDLNLVAHVMRQSLRTDDRIAFPFGLFDPATYDCAPCDRYSSDGRFSLWDFRSEGERRTSDAADLSANGKAQLGGLQHRYNVGLLQTRQVARFNLQAYNLVGEGNINGGTTVPADPTLSDQNTNRTERSTELHLQDAVDLGAQWQLWAGLRHTRLQRDSVRTDGSRPTSYPQSFTTPWLALAYRLGADDLAYASWGQGIESEVVPNKPLSYSNAGQPLPALKSHQTELGYKHRDQQLDWTLAAFDILRPVSSDVAGARAIDGSARHTGIEAEAEWRAGALSLRGSALLLRARREGSADSSLNGKRPTNVPAQSLKLQAAYNIAAVPGLAVLGFVSHEGERQVLPDNSIATPGWTRLDLAARLTRQVSGTTVVWRVGMDNAMNRRAWKEAPYQYDHAYLYPLAPRTLGASVRISF